jgi:hypothetical protein
MTETIACLSPCHTFFRFEVWPGKNLREFGKNSNPLLLSPEAKKTDIPIRILAGLDPRKTLVTFYRRG